MEQRILANIDKAEKAAKLVGATAADNCEMHFARVADIYASRLGRLTETLWNSGQSSPAMRRTIESLNHTSGEWPVCRVRNDEGGFHMQCTGPQQRIVRVGGVRKVKRDKLGNLKMMPLEMVETAARTLAQQGHRFDLVFSRRDDVGSDAVSVSAQATLQSGTLLPRLVEVTVAAANDGLSMPTRR